MSVRSAKKRSSQAAATKGNASETAVISENRHALSIVIALLVIVPLVVFLPVTRCDFVRWDDPRHILENPLYQPTPLGHLADIWAKPYFSAYVPVSSTVWALLADQSVGPQGTPVTTFDPSKYHAANLCVHIANVLLVFFVLRLLVLLFIGDRAKANKNWAAALGALLFAAHPLQVEPVAWVSGFRDLLAAFFSLLATYFYLRAIQETDGKRNAGWILAAASVAFLLALLSKASAASLPLILLVLDLLLKSKIPKERIATLGIWLIASLAVALITKHAEALTAASSADLAAPQVSLWQRPFVAGDSIAFYLCKLFFPYPLGPDYGRTPTWLMGHAWAYLPILVPIALIVLGWYHRSKAAWLAATVGIFIITLLPVSGIVPFNYQHFSTVADRYAYFAMFAPAMALTCLLALYRLRWTICAGGIVLIVLAACTMKQVLVWKNTITLFSQGLRVNPKSTVSYLFLGLQEQRMGDFDRAIPDLRTAVRLDPNYFNQFNLGQALIDDWVKAGSQPKEWELLQEAQKALLGAVQQRPHYEAAHQNLGYTYYKLGRFADAIAQYQAAVADDPTDPGNYFSLSLAYSGAGDKTSAHTFMAKAAMMGYPPAIHMLSPKAPP